MPLLLQPPSDSATPTSGITLKLLSVSLFALMEVIGKYLTGDYPLGQILFFRFAIALITVVPFLIRDGGFRALKTTRTFAHLSRGVMGVTAFLLFFVGLTYLPLSVSSTLMFASPLFMTALSGPLLGEKVGVRRWGAVAFGFVGVLLVMNPGGGTLHWAAVATLSGALLAGLTTVLVRSLAHTEGNSTIVFYFTATGAALGAVMLPFNWVTPTLGDLGLFVLIGLLGGVAQMIHTVSLKMIPISLAAPFDYTKLVWAIVFDFVIWATVPGVRTLAGGLLVILSGLYIIQREARLERRRRPAAAATSVHQPAVTPRGDA